MTGTYAQVPGPHLHVGLLSHMRFRFTSKTISKIALQQHAFSRIPFGDKPHNLLRPKMPHVP